MDEKKTLPAGERQLTELQQKFLAALFGEAQGNFAEAKRLAGYSDYTTVAEVIEPLKDELIRHTKNFLVAHGPKASIKIAGALDEKVPNANVLKAADMILNRMGVLEQKSGDVVVDVSNLPKGGIFILPAKEAQVFTRVEADKQEAEDSED